MEWYVGALRKYADFSGRARPKEYWMFGLFSFLIVVLLAILESILGIAPESDESVLANIYALAVLLPSLAVTVRRLHDTGRSGLWLLIAFIPLIGGLVLLLFLVGQGTPGPNEYGENPINGSA